MYSTRFLPQSASACFEAEGLICRTSKGCNGFIIDTNWPCTDFCTGEKHRALISICNLSERSWGVWRAPRWAGGRRTAQHAHRTSTGARPESKPSVTRWFILMNLTLTPSERGSGAGAYRESVGSEERLHFDVLLSDLWWHLKKGKAHRQMAHTCTHMQMEDGGWRRRWRWAASWFGGVGQRRCNDSGCRKYH